MVSSFQSEEKMRLLLAKNSKRLKFLDQKGAEAHKIDATQNLVKKLSTKIRIAVRVIAKVSKKIDRVRDEELWPQIQALIQGYALFFRPYRCRQIFQFRSLLLHCFIISYWLSAPLVCKISDVLSEGNTLSSVGY